MYTSRTGYLKKAPRLGGARLTESHLKDEKNRCTRSSSMRTVKVPDEYASGLDRLHMFILAAKFTSCSQLIGELLEEIG